MANNLLTSTQILREAAVQTFNNSVFLGAVRRDASTVFEGYKPGDSVTVPRPVRYLSFDGATLQSQDSVEPSVTLQLSYRKHVPMSFSTKEMTLNLADFSRTHITPAAQRLANDIDLAIATEAYQGTGNSTGTPGVTPSTLLSLLLGKAKLQNFCTPVNNPQQLNAVFSPIAEAYLTDGLKGVLSQDIVTDTVRNGIIGKAGGFMVAADQNIVRHTVGAYSGTILTNGATAEAAVTVVFDGAGANLAGFLKKGDVVTFAGCNAVNPVSKADTGDLMQFVVTADVTTAGAAGTIPIFPPMYTSTSGGLQNITALPADNAAIAVRGTASTAYAQNIQFHESGILLATVPLEMPDVPFKARVNMNGISMRLVKDYNISSDLNVCRLDIMFGVKVVYWEHVNRLWG